MSVDCVNNSFISHAYMVRLNAHNWTISFMSVIDVSPSCFFSAGVYEPPIGKTCQDWSRYAAKLAIAPKIRDNVIESQK